MKNAHRRILEASGNSGSHKFYLYYVAYNSIKEVSKYSVACSPRRGNGFNKHDSVSVTVRRSGHKLPDSFMFPHVGQNGSSFKENEQRHSIRAPTLKF